MAAKSSRRAGLAPGSVGCTPDRIRVRVWPRRALPLEEEKALVFGLDRQRADWRWSWVGTTFEGDICYDEDLSVGDLVDHLCALQSLPELAVIDLSQPYCSDQEPVAWLRVRRNTPDLRALCDLYRDRLLSADAVVAALGGFIAQSALDTRDDSS